MRSPTTKLNYEEWTITPEGAEKILKERNKVNRSISKYRSASYASDMKNGDWQLNGECIKFYADGTLADGQQRLKGIAEAGCPITIGVFTNLPKEITIQDRGRSRSTTDSLLLEGIPKNIASTRNTSMIRLHYYIQKGAGVVSDGSVRNFIFRNEDSLALINALGIKSHNKDDIVKVDNAPFRLAIFYAVNAKYTSTETIERFIEIIKTGRYNSEKELAALVLRDDIQRGYLSAAGSGTDRKNAVFMIEKALSDFVAGYPRKVSYKNIKTPTYSNLEINKEA